MLTRKCAVLFATALTILAPPAAAHARGSITYDGTTMTFIGDGGNDHVGVGPSEGELAWVTSGLDTVPVECVKAAYVDYQAYCPWPQRIVVRLGGGNDTFSASGPAWDPFPANVVVEAFGEDGEDRLQNGTTQDGGPGRDRLEGHDGNQVLHGGPGDDVLDGGAGNDQVFGEDGNDALTGDMYKAQGSDLIDGGAGEDAIESDWAESQTTATAPISLTLDGIANDGRPGENDNVVSVERFKVYVGGTFVGTDTADTFEIEPGQLRTPATVNGRGGNDRLIGDDDVETIDGGPGDDYVEGGFDNDTLIGGPGRDTVMGDETGAFCNYWTWCRSPFGNDTIDVRDGELDTVDCGIGADAVKADPADVLTNCETVDTGVAPPERGHDRGRDGSDRGQRRGGGSALALKVAGGKLGAALKRGLVVRLTAPGTGTAKVTVKHGKTVVGAGSAKVRKAGATSVRVTFSKTGKRALKRAKTARLTVSVRFAAKGGATTSANRAVTLKR
jgi:Ca2+-binding RTX toxin-like protein